MNSENLKSKGAEIESIFNTMEISCKLTECYNFDLVEKFEFNLRNLADFKKIGKALEIIKICTHKDIRQVESENCHFAIEIKKENTTLKLIDYEDKFFDTNKYSALLGIDTNNNPVLFDLKRSIHTLISGATGMGKTTIINNIIYELTKKNTKEELQIYTIDMKKVLYVWDSLPNIVNKPVKTATEALKTLEKLGDIMEKRINLLSKNKLSKATDDMFPHILIIIDELADLMLSGLKKYIEEEITHIAQLGRAVNISLIIATQNPIVKVCTSLIKANCPTRIALKTVSAEDSRNILGNKHAFGLDGVGNAIIRTADNPTEHKFKACFLTDDEIKEYLKGGDVNVAIQ